MSWEEISKVISDVNSPDIISSGEVEVRGKPV